MKRFRSLNIKNILLTVIVVLAYSEVNAIEPLCFKAGEKVTYDLYYNLGFIWIHAGNANFSAYETTYRKEPAYMLHVAGNSLSSFDKFFTVRDTFITIVSQKELQPLYYKRVVREDSYWAKDEYWFKDIDENRVSVITECKRRKGKCNVDTLTIKKNVTDLITAIYKMRNYDFSKMKLKERVPFSIIFDDDDKPYNLSLTYLGKEQIELRNGQKYNCIKLRPQLIKGDVFKEEDAMTLWLSDDGNKIPIMIETKIRVGSLKVMLKSVTKPKFPINIVPTIDK
jgi:hypothetical protein